MSQFLLSPWKSDWFSAAFSDSSLRMASNRCRLSEREFSEERLTVMRQSLLSGNYQPQTPVQVALQRTGKAARLLTIPQAPDRLLQSAFARALSAQVDILLMPQSYAYRPRLSSSQALQAAANYLRQGLHWVVRADIYAFFDQISPRRLAVSIEQFVDHTAAKDLLYLWLRTIKPPHVGGIAQGAPISPLLSNLYLDPLDRALATQGIPAIRYADDLLLFAAHQTEAEQHLFILNTLLDTLELSLAPEKTVIGSSGMQFLGQQLEAMPPLVQEKPGQMKEAPSKSPDATGKLVTQPRSSAAPRRSNLIEPRLRTLYLEQPGAYLKLSAQRLILTHQGKTIRELLLRNLHLIIARGAFAISSAALLACQAQGVSFVLLTSNGWVQGVQTARGQTGDVLRAQCKRESDDEFCLRIASAIVVAKIENQRLLLKRYARSRRLSLQQSELLLKRMALRSQVAGTLDELRGLEGLAAREYFSALGQLVDEQWQFHGRNKHPARDPVNAMLSFGYAILYANCRALLEAVGLHPDMGIYHASRAGHAALASDLMEEFRALVVDSTVLKLILQQKVKPEQFALNHAGEMRMADEARVEFLHAMETKMNMQVGKAGPDYRRTIAAQAHLLRAVLLGQSKEYLAYRPR